MKANAHARGVRNRIDVTFSSTLTLNEVELRALEVITLWGDDAFIRAFGEKLGKDLERRALEEGVRSLFRTITAEVRPALGELDAMRERLAKIDEEPSHDR
jgi:hypothetical protein